MANACGVDPGALMDGRKGSTANTDAGENWEMFSAIWEHVRAFGQKDLDLCIQVAGGRRVAIPLIEARRDMDWDVQSPS